MSKLCLVEKQLAASEELNKEKVFWICDGKVFETREHLKLLINLLIVLV